MLTFLKVAAAILKALPVLAIAAREVAAMRDAVAAEREQRDKDKRNADAIREAQKAVDKQA